MCSCQLWGSKHRAGHGNLQTPTWTRRRPSQAPGLGRRGAHSDGAGHVLRLPRRATPAPRPGLGSCRGPRFPPVDSVFPRPGLLTCAAREPRARTRPRPAPRARAPQLGLCGLGDRRWPSRRRLATSRHHPQRPPRGPPPAAPRPDWPCAAHSGYLANYGLLRCPSACPGREKQRSAGGSQEALGCRLDMQKGRALWRRENGPGPGCRLDAAGRGGHSGGGAWRQALAVDWTQLKRSGQRGGADEAGRIAGGGSVAGAVHPLRPVCKHGWDLPTHDPVQTCFEPAQQSLLGVVLTCNPTVGHLQDSSPSRPTGMAAGAPQ
nr:uncharacterized protein LOC111752596 [Loxodonta africana]